MAARLDRLVVHSSVETEQIARPIEWNKHGTLYWHSMSTKAIKGIDKSITGSQYTPSHAKIRIERETYWFSS